MLYTKPDYYDKFHCLADGCEDTCCAGWQIVIDDKSLRNYQMQKGSFGKRLRDSIDVKESTFRQTKDKRCAFLNEENLCDLQLALGEEALCKTCRNYPRHIEEFENVREITLSVSCPEVARILMEQKEPVQLVSVEKEGEEEFEDFDPFLYSFLVDARAVMRDILQDRKKPLSIRAGLVLGIAHDMQVRINRGDLFSCEEVFRKYQKESAAAFVKKKLTEKFADKDAFYHWSKHLFGKLHELELLFPDWEAHLSETEFLLYDMGSYVYEKRRRNFGKWAKENLPDLEIMLEQLMVYFMDTYFCGAVYDGEVYAKMRMAVDSVFYLYEMFTARFIKNEGELDKEDIILLVYRFSRELEHSDTNLERMEQFHIYRT
ncbi:MAG: flagellin lysine-N-methylase [Lachnospiraceae bacterium]|nr:flagellin lysine-N-methylase [Lachnospiraceae bacterium]